MYRYTLLYFLIFYLDILSYTLVILFLDILSVGYFVLDSYIINHSGNIVYEMDTYGLEIGR
jgi:hypothetical protein